MSVHVKLLKGRWTLHGRNWKPCSTEEERKDIPPRTPLLLAIHAPGLGYRRCVLPGRWDGKSFAVSYPKPVKGWAGGNGEGYTAFSLYGVVAWQVDVNRLKEKEAMVLSKRYDPEEAKPLGFLVQDHVLRFCSRCKTEVPFDTKDQRLFFAGIRLKCSSCGFLYSVSVG